MEAFEFIVQGVGITLLGTFGIFGNAISVFVLTRPQLKSSITWLLLGLTIFDLIFLVLNILIYSLISVFTYLDVADSYRNAMDPLEFPYLVYINDTAQTASVYFTIGIALERYCVIRWPLESRPYCTYEKCRLYSIVVFAFACFYQVQRFAFPAGRIEVDHEILSKNCPDLLPNVNQTNSGEVGADDDYEQYFFRWPYLTFIMILPSVVLIVLNTLIWLALRKGNKKRAGLGSKSREEKERSITVMLVAVVTVFIICQSVFYIMALLEAFQQCAWESVKFYLIPMDLFLITTNSSVNFLIYCTFGSKFREQFRLCFQKYGLGLCSSDGLMEVSASGEKSTKEEKSSTAV